MEIDSVTADESDSLYVTIQPYDWNYFKGGFVASSNEVLYLVFDTADTYTSTTIDYLNWTSGTGYGADIGGKFGPSTGFVITVYQLANDNAGADSRINIGVMLLE